MIRKLVLAMTILALAAVPLPAWAARDGAHEDRHETRGSHEQFHGHERFGHGPAIGFGFYPSPYYAYAPPACAWQPGYAVNQPCGCVGSVHLRTTVGAGAVGLPIGTHSHTSDL